MVVSLKQRVGKDGGLMLVLLLQWPEQPGVTLP